MEPPPIQSSCPKCGMPQVEGWRFCPHCGKGHEPSPAGFTLLKVAGFVLMAIGALFVCAFGACLMTVWR